MIYFVKRYVYSVKWYDLFCEEIWFILWSDMIYFVKWYDLFCEEIWFILWSDMIYSLKGYDLFCEGEKNNQYPIAVELLWAEQRRFR